jgi:RNA polymerase primary sigma factor
MSSNEFDLRLDVRYRNNRLHQLIFEKYSSVKKFCDAAGTHPTFVGDLLNLTMSPLKKNGQYRETCQQIADHFFVDVEALFPLELYNVKQTALSIELRMEQLPFHECLLLPAEEEVTSAVVLSQLRDRLEEVLPTLTPRQEKVLRLFFGIGLDESGRQICEHEVCEIALELGVTDCRVGQILQKALSELRRPFRSRKLKSFAT